MSQLKQFWRHEGGAAIQSISLMAAAVAFAAIAGAHFLDRAVQDGALSGVAQIDAITHERYSRATANLPRGVGGATNQTRQVTLDYTPTGSIPDNLAQPVILDPCDGARK